MKKKSVLYRELALLAGLLSWLLIFAPALTPIYAWPVKDANSEINPVSVKTDINDQKFTYFIQPEIQTGNKGIGRIEIEIPDSYSDIKATTLRVGGSAVNFTHSVTGTSYKTLNIIPDSQLTENAAMIEIVFTADTPLNPDNGIRFVSELFEESDGTGASVICKSGDAENQQAVGTDTNMVIAVSSLPCASIIAEIDPQYVKPDIDNKEFIYLMKLAIGNDEFGVNKVYIKLPENLSKPKKHSFLDVKVDGIKKDCQFDTSGNTILLTFTGEHIRGDSCKIYIPFTADTDKKVDSGRHVISYVDSNQLLAPVSAISGDAGSEVKSNQWEVEISNNPKSSSGSSCFINSIM